LGRARAPTRPLAADGQPTVGNAEANGLPAGGPLEVNPRLPAVPAREIADVGPRQCHPTEPDDGVGRTTERERLAGLRELPLEPAAVPGEEPSGCGLRNARWQDHLDVALPVHDDPRPAGPRRPANGELDLHEQRLESGAATR